VVLPWLVAVSLTEGMHLPSFIAPHCKARQ
jgi:hypothetical protein